VPIHPLFTIDLLHDALTELGSLARAEGKVIEIAIYGGSALMLAWLASPVAQRSGLSVPERSGRRSRSPP
jgi:hypothetical protein